MRQLFLTENGLHPTVGKSENIRQNTMSELNRRKFLLRAGTGLSAAWVTANWPALLSAATHAHNAAKAATPPKFEFFTPEEAAEVEAITARIVPTDDTPGAREAGVVYSSIMGWLRSEPTTKKRTAKDCPNCLGE